MHRIILSLTIISLTLVTITGCSAVKVANDDFDMSQINSDVLLRNVDFTLDIMKELNKAEYIHITFEYFDSLDHDV
jgi:hypothetical protein